MTPWKYPTKTIVDQVNLNSQNGHSYKQSSVMLLSILLRFGSLTNSKSIWFRVPKAKERCILSIIQWWDTLFSPSGGCCPYIWDHPLHSMCQDSWQHGKEYPFSTHFYHILCLKKFTLTMLSTSNFQCRTRPPTQEFSELMIYLYLNTTSLCHRMGMSGPHYATVLRFFPQCRKYVFFKLKIKQTWSMVLCKIMV